MLGLSAAGLVFAGYLSGVKLFTETCAFNEQCPYFLGYPSCWYGFGMYLIMFATLVSAAARKTAGKGPEKVVAFVSFLGILFAGYFAVAEIAAWFGPAGVTLYALGLPTCVYGLIFYVAIFVIALRALRARPASAGGPAAPTPTAPPGPGPAQN